MSTTITREMTINQVIKKYPEVIGVFNRFRVDSCCGGARTLEETAREDKVHLNDLLAALNEAAIAKQVKMRRG